MSTIYVNSTAGLLKALTTAQSGDHIALASGNYSAVNIQNVNFATAVTITSQDPTHEAVLSGLMIKSSSGLNFDHLEALSQGSVNNGLAVNVQTSSNIAFQNMFIHGSLDNDPSNDAGGMLINVSHNVTVQNSTFHDLANALTQQNSDHVTINNNNFSYIRSDGVDGCGTSYLTIANNTFTDFFPASNPEHPDAIQIWTTGATSIAHDITISNNSISIGDGQPMQGIFVTDQVGLSFANVTIANNTVVGGETNAITAQAVTGLNVIGNTITATSKDPYMLHMWLAYDKNVNMLNNSAPSYVLTNNTNFHQTGNIMGNLFQSATMTSSVSATLSVLSNTLILTGSQQINGGASAIGSTVFGNNAGDRLYGATGNDTLIGGSGNDIFIPRGGNDLMTGGGGSNGYQISSYDGHDTITDFHKGDSIDVRALTSIGLHATVADVAGNATISFGSSSPVQITLLGVHSSDVIANSVGFGHA